MPMTSWSVTLAAERLRTAGPLSRAQSLCFKTGHGQAKEDWQAMRFPLIPGDDREFIALPAVPTTVSYP